MNSWKGLIEQGQEVTHFGTGDSATQAPLYSLWDEAQWPPNPLAEVNHVSWALSRIVRDDFDLILTPIAL